MDNTLRTSLDHHAVGQDAALNHRPVLHAHVVPQVGVADLGVRPHLHAPAQHAVWVGESGWVGGGEDKERKEKEMMGRERKKKEEMDRGLLYSLTLSTHPPIHPPTWWPPRRRVQ